MKELDGKNVVVTGANRGIGGAIAEKFMENGASLFAVVRNAEKFRDLKEDLEGRFEREVIPVQCEFSDEESVKKAAKEILTHKKKIDVLVNNVGISYPNGAFNMTPMQQVKDAFQINLFSPLLLTQILSRNMIRNRSGCIIFLSSITAFDGGSNIEYVSSKAAIVGAVRRLAVEYGEYGIRVNGIAPGFTDTDMISGLNEEQLQIVKERSILKRNARPEEIAELALFLGSSRSSYITGQTIRVDGGQLTPLKA